MSLSINLCQYKNSIDHPLKFPITKAIFTFILLIVIQNLCHAQIDSVDTALDTVVTNIPSIDQDIQDSLVKEKPKSFLDGMVIYPTRDSTVMDINNQLVKLYGNAEVEYQDIVLKAEYIEFSFVDLSVKAYGMPDSTETIIGKPDFKQGSESFRADTILYNFKSERGLIKEVRTNDGESYIHTAKSKKQKNNHIHNYKGKFTTCDAEKPHFHFAFNKMVVVPNKSVVTGPVIMKVGNVLTPLALPFGFFPNSDKRSAGVIVPGYGQSSQQGIFFLGGGFYQPLGQNWDTQMTGDIYSRGSWGLANNTRYIKKYKNTGSFRLSYNKRITGDKKLEGFPISKSNAFNIQWNHTLNPKARPGTSFSASVNMGTSNNFTNNLNSSQALYLNNTFTSSIRYSKNWDGKPYNLSASFRHSQNTLNRSFNFVLPNLTFNVNRFFLPLSFLKQDGISKQKFYEKIGVSYSVNVENKLNTTEPQLRFDNFDKLRSEFVNGARHNIGASTSLKMGPVSFNPSFSMTERWHFQKLKKLYEFEKDTTGLRGEYVINDIKEGGFFATRDMRMGASFTTKAYGTFNFRSKKIQAIRHTMTPSIGFSYTPEFDYNEFLETMQDPEIYNPFSQSAFTQSSFVSSGSITFGLANNLEAKIRSRNDSISKFEKVRLIENFTASTSYNLFADSLNLSDIRLSARTRLFKKINFTYSGTFDPYQNDTLGQKIDKFRWNGSGGILRNKNTTIAIGGSFRSNKTINQPKPDPLLEEDQEELNGIRNLFVDFSVPWNLTMNYTLNVRRNFEGSGDDLIDKKTIQQGILFYGDFSIFKLWKVGVNSGYDFTNSEFTSTTLSLHWDLHCWEFNASFIPFGVRKSYTLNLNVKSSLLKDLKWQHRRGLGETNFWN